jgi:hypothetical protein
MRTPGRIAAPAPTVAPVAISTRPAMIARDPTEANSAIEKDFIAVYQCGNELAGPAHNPAHTYEAGAES